MVSMPEKIHHFLTFHMFHIARRMKKRKKKKTNQLTSSLEIRDEGKKGNKHVAWYPTF
jgi:hypothetical protein